MKPNQIDLLWLNISELPYFRGFLRAIEGRFLREFELKTQILDLGCGDGHFGTRAFPEIPKIGVDPSFSALLEARAFSSYQFLINCDGSKLPFKNNSVKMVVSNSVLEHIQSVDFVIKEANRVLDIEGCMLATMPNQNFTENLQIAISLEKIRLNRLANAYRKFFNRISRHYHTDSKEGWQQRFLENNFKISSSFNYFPQRSLRILEFGHYFGLPSWINKKIFGKWVLFPTKKNPFLRRIFEFLGKEFIRKKKSEDGAYTLISAIKKT